VVPAEQISIEWLSMSGVRGKGALTLLLAPVQADLLHLAGAGRHAPPPPLAGGGLRRIRHRSWWRRGLAHAPAAHDP
jgi:hypothetical protein